MNRRPGGRTWLRRTAASVLLALASCSPPSQSPNGDGTTQPKTSEPAPASASASSASPSIAALNARAGDASLSRAERCAAVFELFDKHLQPMADSATVRSVITQRGWFTPPDDMPVTVLGGWIPVEFNLEDSSFAVHCVAAPRADLGGQRWSDWVIYGRIGGKTVASLGPFLDAPAGVTLIEYALCYPDGRIETYSPKGRRSTPPMSR